MNARYHCKPKSEPYIFLTNSAKLSDKRRLGMSHDSCYETAFLYYFSSDCILGRARPACLESARRLDRADHFAGPRHGAKRSSPTPRRRTARPPMAGGTVRE